jgi:nucleoside phosphorylase
MAEHDEAVRALVEPGNELDLTRHIIEFDPRQPSHYLFSATPHSGEALDMATHLTPDPIPWPAGLAPTPRTMDPAPVDDNPLPAADVLVVTYTVAEGYALADVLTPGVGTALWTPYRNGWPALRGLIEGHRAPALQFARAGLWHTATIGDKSVVVFKSDLHPSTDGPNLPMKALWKQMIDQVRPKMIITTGTAGGVQADTLLGDVIVARHVKWDCTTIFANSPFANDSYLSKLEFFSEEFDEAARDLIPVNAAHLPKAARAPYVWRDTAHHAARTITTDFFAFDDAQDHYGLRAYDAHARAVEMDDAALGLACADLDDPPLWISVRNASDPQMSGGDISTEKTQAAAIYEKYGYWTSIGSVIACWVLITKLV